MKFLKWIGILLVVLVILVIGAGIALPLLIDPNSHKDRITTLVKQQTGRDFAIAGEIEWSVFPFVGLGLSDLTLGNAAGFNAPHFAKIQSADISVKLMPLFKKQVEVSGVTLNGLDLNLETNAAGATNWEDLANAGADDSQAQGSNADLTVGFVELSDSRLNWIDGKAGQTIVVDQINVETGLISAAAPIEVDYSLHLASAELKLDAVLSGKANVRNALSEAPITATVNGLKLDGKADTISFELRGDAIEADLGTQLIKLVEVGVTGQADQLPFDLAIDNGMLNLEQDSAELPQIALKSGPMSASLSAKASNISSNMSVAGSLDVPQFDPRALLKQMGQEVPETTDSSALGGMSLRADYSYGGDRASLKNLRAKLDDTNLSGTIDVSSIERLAATFALNIDQIDLDRYLPPASESAEPAAASGPVDVDFGNLNGRVKLGKAIVANAELTDLDVTIRTTPKGLSITETASIYEGKSQGSVQLDAASGRLQFSNEIGGVQASPLIKALADSELLNGIGELSVELDVGNVWAENPVSTLNGTVSFQFSDGAIMGFNVFSLLRQASAKLGLDPDASSAASEQTDFSKFVFSANVVNGVLQTNDFDLRSPFLRAAGSGSINLADMSLDYQLRPTLVKAPEGQGGAGLDKLEGVELPIGLAGTVFEPKIRLDPKALLMAWQGKRIDVEKEKIEAQIDEKKDELKDKLVGKLFGGDKSEPAPQAGSAQPAAGEAAAPVQPQDSAAEAPEEVSTEDKVKNRLRGILGKKLGGSDEEEDGDGG